MTGKASGAAAVRVFSRASEGFRSLEAFDAGQRQGVRLGVVDVNGDGQLDVLAGLGPDAAPEVRGFDGETLEGLASFFAEGAAFRGGLFVAGGR